jgi:hypothetical protein
MLRSGVVALPRHWMEVSGQLHDPAALTPEKYPPVHIEYEA